MTRRRLSSPVRKGFDSGESLGCCGRARYVATLIAALACTFPACTTTPQLAAPPAHPTADPITPTQPIALFNGRDLTGLYSFLADTGRSDPRGVFTVTDAGHLRISGDGLGYLSTLHSYRDYRLVVELRWGERNWGDRVGKARDSGIFLHAAGPDGNSYDGGGAFKSAIECQVMEGSIGDFILVKGRDESGRPLPLRLTTTVAAQRDADGWYTFDPAGRPVTLDNGGRVNWFNKSPAWRDAFGFRGANDVEHPAGSGKWNLIECICEGDRVTIKVNGVVVNEAYGAFPTAGPILLQSEGSQVFVRRFEVWPVAGE